MGDVSKTSSINWRRGRGVWVSAGLILTSVVFSVCLIEFAVTFILAPDKTSDRELGWRLRPNIMRAAQGRTRDGGHYPISFSTNALGVRTFGSNPQAPIRILVLGDSFTAGAYASDDRMWYAILVEQLARATNTPRDNYYVVAGGANGYGTYQELLLAQRLAGHVAPTLYVHQFCDNDFTNNHHDWEGASIVRAQYLRRPYASIGGIAQPRFHSGFLASLYRSAIGRLTSFNSVDALITKWQYGRYGSYFSGTLSADLSARYEDESIIVTRSLLAELRSAYAQIPAVMVNCSSDPAGPNKSWRTLAAAAGFIPIAAPSDLILAAKADGHDDLLNEDGAHLSEKGNAAYGAALAQEILALRIALHP